MEIKTFDDLRYHIGLILGQSIPKGGFESIALEVDKNNGLNNHNLIRILILLYNYLEGQSLK